MVKKLGLCGHNKKLGLYCFCCDRVVADVPVIPTSKKENNKLENKFKETKR